jgi:hypothetical protein
MKFLTFTVSLLLLTSCTKDKAETVLVCPDTISFSTQIMPMITDNCIGCHGPGNTSPALTNHSEIANNATKISKSIHGSTTLMPIGGPQLADTLLQYFDCWVKQGKLDN